MPNMPSLKRMKKIAATTAADYGPDAFAVILCVAMAWIVYELCAYLVFSWGLPVFCVVSVVFLVAYGSFLRYVAQRRVGNRRVDRAGKRR